MEQIAKLPMAIERGGVHQGYFGRSSRWKVSRLIPASVSPLRGVGAARLRAVEFLFFVLKPGRADQRAAAAQPFGVSVRTRTATAATTAALSYHADGFSLRCGSHQSNEPHFIPRSF